MDTAWAVLHIHVKSMAIPESFREGQEFDNILTLFFFSLIFILEYSDKIYIFNIYIFITIINI